MSRSPTAIGVISRAAASPTGTPTTIFTIVRNPYDGTLVTMFSVLSCGGFSPPPLIHR